jgi:hypothetical protein
MRLCGAVLSGGVGAREKYCRPSRAGRVVTRTRHLDAARLASRPPLRQDAILLMKTTPPGVRRGRVWRPRICTQRRAFLGPRPVGVFTTTFAIRLTQNREGQMGHMIDLRAADGLVSEAYVAQPKPESTRAAIVVLQEIFGVNRIFVRSADGFALGFFGRLPLLRFHVSKKDVSLGYSASRCRHRPCAENTSQKALPAPGVMADVQAAISTCLIVKRRQSRCGGLLLGRPVELAYRHTLVPACPSGGHLLRWRHDPSRLSVIQNTFVPTLAHFGNQRRTHTHGYR